MSTSNASPPQATGKCLCKSPKRRLVVAFDGTENQFGPKIRLCFGIILSSPYLSLYSSHVVEFYSRIVKNPDQPSYYTSGIGTYPKPGSRTQHFRTAIKSTWAAMTAWNFESNLLAGYRWLSENYKQGDQIFLLGFSRGAYQARVLAAMIAKVGILRTGNNEQIAFAFDIYKDPKSSQDIEIELLSDGTARVKGDKHTSDDSVIVEGTMTTTSAKEFRKAFCNEVHVHFVGVWDTVSSVGLFRNRNYPGADSAEHICFFRHALALDERRVKFIPEYVVAPRSWFEKGAFGQPRCKEVWFRGSHSDIGGGHLINPSLDVGGVPSRWMAYEAMIAGLEMIPFHRDWSKNDLKGRSPTNSMTPFYLFVEYFPLAVRWQDTSVSPVELKEQAAETSLGTSKRKQKYRRVPHRERPRFVHGHQKLHPSVRLHNYKEKDKHTIAHLQVSYDNVQVSWDHVYDSRSLQNQELQPERFIRASQLEDPRLINGRADDLLTDEVTLSFDSDSDALDKMWQKSIKVKYRRPDLQSGTYGFSKASIVPPHITTMYSTISGALHPKEDSDSLTLVNLDQIFELDIYDYESIPLLLQQIRKNFNIIEFLERINLMAHETKGRALLRKSNVFQDILNSILLVTNDMSGIDQETTWKKLELGVRLAAKVPTAYKNQAQERCKGLQRIICNFQIPDSVGIPYDRAMFALLDTDVASGISSAAPISILQEALANNPNRAITILSGILDFDLAVMQRCLQEDVALTSHLLDISENATGSARTVQWLRVRVSLALCSKQLDQDCEQLQGDLVSILVGKDSSLKPDDISAYTSQAVLCLIIICAKNSHARKQLFKLSNYHINSLGKKLSSSGIHASSVWTALGESSDKEVVSSLWELLHEMPGSNTRMDCQWALAVLEAV